MTILQSEDDRVSTRRDRQRDGRVRRRRVLVHRLLPLVMVLAGVVALLYPVLATQFNNVRQHAAAEAYSATVEGVSGDQLAASLAAARNYNEHIEGIPILDPWLTQVSSNPTSTQYQDYLRQLGGLSAMARLHVPSVGIDLPVYHGTSEDTLARGVGHLYGTSLPVGGEGTHTVLTSHTGLSTATLFDHLDKVKVGDKVYVDVSGESLAYEVDQIKVVLPTDIQDLAVDPDLDLLTVFTCTPYAVNTHRLLVRGHRIPYDPVVAAAAAPVVRGGLVMEPWMYWLIGAAAASFLALGVALGSAVRVRRRRPAPVAGGRASLARQRRRGNRFGRAIPGR